ncbi:ribulose-bisphosphate carboxylase large subunit family protein [Telmatospirillum sp. J64-1]|uniref:ribulose-bisphosphate carboxylase large subunit family protein n=1 Tax=Telmatospirillum sp. J64-1 TaxID=2502183 RepID=UPI00115DB005|nr:ribulose-bisphosphate carboxylase large subunit family protein [Telmatospirillum sp. J64-1]
MDQRIRAKYLVETALPLEKAAASLAGEQSTGTFIALARETEAFLDQHAAHVERITELDHVPGPALPGASSPPGALWRRAELEISWPLHNIGPSLPNLMSMVAGNMFELRQFSGIRLLDIHLPDAFAERYPGPQFGIQGTRDAAGVQSGPILGTIIKPSIGMSAEETGALVAELCEAGIDFIKDDELQSDGPSCPFEDRVTHVMRAIDAHAQKTGKRVMFAFNVTGEIDEMKRRHDAVVKAGGTCVMVSLNSCGLTGFSAFRAHCELPIHGHRNGWGALTRHPSLGFDYVAWQKLWRLAGADQMHVNGLKNKFYESDASVLASAKACLTPMFEAPLPACTVMPVFSSGQTALHARATFDAMKTTDLIFTCGGGIMGHPGGPAAGIASIRQAWDAAIAGEDLSSAAARHPELAKAVEIFG